MPDSTITLTQWQAKITNIIFAEHKQWSKEIPLLYNQIDNYNKLIVNYNKTDSLKNTEINILKADNKKLKKAKNLFKITTFGSLILLLSSLIF